MGTPAIQSLFNFLFMNQPVAVIFDMDGVICHTNPYHSRAFRAFFSNWELYPSDSEFAEHMFGKSNSYILSHFFQREITGEELKNMEEQKESLFRSLYEPHVESIAGFANFIDDLVLNDTRLGVATSAPRANLELILSKIHIKEKLGSMLASENVRKHKPDPEVYLASAKNLGVKPDQCVVFEDSFSGISAAINAGMRVVGVLSSHTKDELPPCNLYIENYKQMSFTSVRALFD
jgi:beta-phosphoglucomutase